MIDWEEILNAESTDELKEAKLWLFRENIRIQNERKELESQKDKFLKEKNELSNELDVLSRRAAMESKRLKEENLFFNKKMEILQDGFRQLDEDRKALEREKKKLAAQKEDTVCGQAPRISSISDIAGILFRSASNPLALRKRYRDLVKIFHPDNLFGDEELAQQINREFIRRRSNE